MARKNHKARKLHRGPSTAALMTAEGYITKRDRARARRERAARNRIAQTQADAA